MVLDKNFLKVEVPLNILKKYCIWTIIKFIKDDYHTQHNSSRNDLMGGFLDRWINRIPESLIFKELLSDEEFDVVNDDFFYTNEVEKNAPDVIGLVKRDKYGKKIYYPFYIFNMNSWIKFNQYAPFIEMKTTRNSQKLATIAVRQDEEIDDNFYVLVESNINDNYLLHLLDKNILNNANFNKFYKFDSTDDFINGSYNLIGNPNEIIYKELSKLDEMNIIDKEDNKFTTIGNYKLCGIFKGSAIKKYSSKVGINEEKEIPISPRYLKNIEELYDDKYFSDSFDYDYHVDSNQSIPFLINVATNSNVFVEFFNLNKIIISVNGIAEIFDLNCNKIKEFSNGIYELNFKNFNSNLYKYYYLDNVNEFNFEDFISDNNYEFDRREVYSGIFSFYGDEFKNLKFDLTDILNSKCKIYNISKSTIDCKCCNDESINSFFFKSGSCKLKFNNKGDFESVDSIKSCKKNEILYGYDENNDFHLNLKFDLYDNSKLRFINRNKGNCILCIDGFAIVHDYNTQKSHIIYDSFYDIKIYDGTKNKTKNIFFKINDLDKINRINNPQIECNKSLQLDSNNFYIPDDDMNNIKIKFDISKNSKISIVKEKYTDETEEVLSYLNIMIDGKGYINGNPIEDNANNIYRKIWKLNFENFERTSKNEEYVLSKEAIISSNDSCEDELIETFKEYINKFNKSINFN